MPLARRTTPKSHNGWAPLLGINGFGAVIVAGLIAYNTFASADVLEGLRGIQIRPVAPEERTVQPGGILRLTAVGDFATMEIPVRAEWSFVGPSHNGSLLRCANTPRCRFRAGNQPGTARIRASVASFSDSAVIVIAP